MITLPEFHFQETFDIEHHIWITARRKPLWVKQMSANHIQNCIACLEGRGPLEIPDGYLGGKEKWLKIFNNELVSRQ